jgi:hypothetical protein
VIENVAQQPGHMTVGERVMDVLGLAPPRHETRGKDLSKAGRDGRKFVAFRLGGFSDATFALLKPEQQPGSANVSCRTQQDGGGLQCLAVWRHEVPALRMRTKLTGQIVGSWHGTAIHHSIDCQNARPRANLRALPDRCWQTDRMK